MAIQHPRQRHPFRAKVISVAVGACFSVSVQTVLAAPTGAKVVSGTATVSQQGNLTTVTNSPGAVINWQAFSIGANEVTRFIQQSAASSVLNRVVGVDPSIILGVLQSNGRVLLINPNGIVFGAGAQIDVAGLVASSLNLSNADFAAGRLRFSDTPGAGSVNNQGAITTPTGGQVYLIAPNVQNSGIITSPQGEIILAAGRSVDLVDAGTPNLRIEITAPDTQAINIGQIIARSGKIGIYAALVKNSGEIRADGVVVGANGEILLRAKQNVTLENGSVISASGPTAGKITIQAESGTVAMAGRLEANATQGKGGTINISGQSITADSGVNISASGTQGGTVIFTATGTGTASAAGASQITLNTPSVLLPTGNQISVGGGQSAGALTVTTPSTGNTVLLADAATIGGASIVQPGEGSVVLQGSIAVTGSEGRGGNVTITAHNEITLDATSRILANGHAGGEVRVEATKGTLLASGLIDATGGNGPGGMVLLLAPRVALLRRAIVDVSGAVGGGLALIGGDYQGRNPLIQNASRTYFGPDAIIRADAITSGNGGKVIVWSDDGTQSYGTISARGGALSGNGGFVEVSGKAWLDFSASVNTSAPHGKFGTLLLDPKNLEIITSGGAFLGNHLFGDNPAGNSTIDPVNINGLMTPVLLQADNNITFTDAIGMTNPGTSLTAQAGNSIFVNANITTTNGDITLIANETTANGVTGGNRDAGVATISMATGTTLNAGAGNIFLKMNTGSGHAGTSGNIVVENLTAANVSIIHDGLTPDSAILRASGSSLITASSAVFMELENATGANASIGTIAEPIRIDTPVLEAHYHNASGGIFFDSPNARDLQIGGVPGAIFSGLVRGVQTISGGPIEIQVNGKLSQLAGAAGCGLTGGTGGPICAGGGVYNPGDTVFLRAADMNLQGAVSGWDVYLAPYGRGTVTLGSAGVGGSLHLSQTEVNFVDAITLNIGDQFVSGDVNFAGDLTTPLLFGIRTSGHIASGAFTLTVGGTGNGNTDLYAQTGIQLNIKTATLSAYNAGSTGNINIAETSASALPLTLDAGTSAESLRNDADGGSITLTTTNRSIVVADSILGQGDVTLGAKGDLTVSGVTVYARDNVVLTSTVGNILIDSGAEVKAGNGSYGPATVTVTSTAGSVTIDNAKVWADGGDGGIANVTLTAATGITISGDGGEGSKGVFAYGGNSSSFSGGDATITLAGGTGPILIDQSAVVLATGGGGNNFVGGDADITFTTTGSITLDTGSRLYAQGGYGYEGGGAATITLTSGNGGIKLDTGAVIEAYGGYAGDGGEGSTTGGAATVELTATGTGGILIQGAGTRIYAEGGGGDFDGGDATITLNAASGGIKLDTGALVKAQGGDGGAGGFNYAGNGGSATIELTTTAGGDINILAASQVQALGGYGHGYDSGNGGSATVELSSAGAINILGGSKVQAFGGHGNGGDYGYGGDATINLSSGVLGITADGGEGWALGGDGYGYYDGNGGVATINLIGGTGPILLKNASQIEAKGGYSDLNYGGDATVSLTTAGNITIDNLTTSITALGGSGYYDSGFGRVEALTTAGDILLKGGTISADGAEGSYIALGAVGGKIDGNGLSGTILSSPSGPIYLGALKGIGTVGNPVRFTDDGQDIEVCNGGDFLAMCSAPQTGRSGDIVLAQTTGTINIDGISNVINLAPNGGFDITAETGGILVTNNITLAANGSGNIGLHALGGSIQVDNGSGLTTANGTITLQSDALDLFGDPGSINAGAGGTVALRTALTTTSINLGGTGSAGILGIDNSTLSSISAGTVRIGDLANTGGIAVSGIDLTGIANTLSLVTGSGNITQSGALTATNLAIKSNGNVTLNDASNSVLNVAADLTGGVGALGFTATGYNVAGAAIDGVSGVKTNGGNITLASPNPGEGIFVASSGGGYTIDTGLVGGVLTISTGDWLVVNDGADMRAGQIALSSANSLGIAVGQINLVATGVGATAVNFSAPSGPITSSADITSAGGVRMNSDGDIRLDNGHSGSTIIAAGAVDIQSMNGIIHTGVPDTEYVNITGGSVTLNAKGYIDLGRGVAGSNGSVHATAGNIDITSLTDSFGGCAVVSHCYRGDVIADAGNITINTNW